MLRFHWTAYLVVKGVALLAASVFANDPIGVAPGALSLCFAPFVAYLEHLASR